MNSFNELGVHPYFTEKLKERSIEKPTAIQNLVIKRLLEGKNVLFRSATGTGKTFAYLLPALQQLIPDKNAPVSKRHFGQPSVLICAPTLELCSQIKAEVDFLLPPPFQSALLIGSVRIDRQIEVLKKTKPAVVIGNPNRMLALTKMGKLKLSGMKFLVLDEADRLTVQECFEETKELLGLIKKNTKKTDDFPAADSAGSTAISASCHLQVTGCSATVSEKTRRQLGPLFETAEIVESSDHEILRERIEHWALFSEKRRKIQTLRSLLAALTVNAATGRSKKSRAKVLIFTSRNDEAGLVLSRLQYHHVSAAGLFGKVNKKPLTSMERKAALDSFREGRVDVLVSTDLAARGLDIPDITHVIALDVPSGSEAYIHRCGRTGRAGKRGIMITVGDETQMRLLALLEKKLKIRVIPKELYHGRVCPIKV